MFRLDRPGFESLVRVQRAAAPNLQFSAYSSRKRARPRRRLRRALAQFLRRTEMSTNQQLPNRASFHRLVKQVIFSLFPLRDLLWLLEPVDNVELSIWHAA